MFHTNTKIPIIDKIYEFYKLFFKYSKSFPKCDRYSLGIKIKEITLKFITKTFTINQLPSPLREKPLLELNSQNELLKLLIRLCYELKILQERQFLTLQEHLQENSKMINGWVKYLKTPKK